MAAQLGCTVDAVKTRVHEGLACLRSFFARKGIAVGVVALSSGLAREAIASEPTLVATCVQTALTPAAAPGAMALANGVNLAMYIKTATLVGAGCILAGTCLTAAWVLRTKTPMTPAVDQHARTSGPTFPAVAAPAWASESGHDLYGTWADVDIAGVIQRFRWIEPGTFTMGTSQAEVEAALVSLPGSKREWFHDEVPHDVTLTRGFWMADSVCSQQLWFSIMSSNPSRSTDPRNPVEQVSWDDCQQFLARLNDRIPGGGFRLPSEAQWEYVCRAGSISMLRFGSSIALEELHVSGWHAPGAAGAVMGDFQHTLAVKSPPVNPWGLYDMQGNVAQWCHDWYGELTERAEIDPMGAATGTLRVYRGGGWYSHGGMCISRSAYRSWCAPSHRDAALGFRIAAMAPSTGHADQSHRGF